MDNNDPTLPKGYKKCAICNEVHKKLYPPDDWTLPENDREWVRRHRNTNYYKVSMNWSAQVLDVPKPYPDV